jgi:hypothetical protein
MVLTASVMARAAIYSTLIVFINIDGNGCTGQFEP